MRKCIGLLQLAPDLLSGPFYFADITVNRTQIKLISLDIYHREYSIGEINFTMA